jgi:hypothetical protein
MRAIGAMPSGSAAVQIAAAESSPIAECSISMNNASKPLACAIIAISGERPRRSAMQKAT